jgi:hypothetical protein
MDQTQVELRVGRDRVPIMVHKELLCYCSEFFRGAFEGGFRESEEKSLGLSDVEREVFRLFQHWLYAHSNIGSTPKHHDVKQNHNRKRSIDPKATGKRGTYPLGQGRLKEYQNG